MLTYQVCIQTLIPLLILQPLLLSLLRPADMRAPPSDLYLHSLQFQYSYTTHMSPVCYWLRSYEYNMR